MNAVQKNNFVFFLIWIHIFLGIANLLTTHLILDKSWNSQLTSCFALLTYGVMSYFLLKRKNWMRITVFILFFLSLPLSLLALKFNMLFFNNLFQIILSVCIVILLLRKDVKRIYVTKTKVKDVSSAERRLVKGDLLSNIKLITDMDFVYITDMECVDDVDCYRDVIGNILKLANITSVEVNPYEGEQRTIHLKGTDTDHFFFLSGNSDYIDSCGLVKGLNEFLKKMNKSGKIYTFRNCDWGHEGGFLYVTEIEPMERLMEAGNGYEEYGEISDGVKKNIPITEDANRVESVELTKLVFFKIMLLLLVGVALFQVGAADLVIELKVVSMGVVSGIISGVFWIAGLYVIKCALRMINR